MAAFLPARRGDRRPVLLIDAQHASARRTAPAGGRARRHGRAVARHAAAALAIVLVAAWPARDAAAQPDAPLFASHEPVELTLAVPVRTLVRRRSRRPEVEGTVTYLAGGDPVELDVEVRTRGFSRLELCTFPPLRLDFRRSQVPGTLFAGQNNLKLVTLCRERPGYEQHLELEYLAYRIYNEVTDLGFRVRKAAMRYVDTERGDVVEAPAFFIEDIDGLAARLGTEELEVPRLGLDELDPPQQALLGVFQYLIGNADWAGTDAADGEDCCHNMGVIAPRAGAFRVVTVPYDFDQSGLVDPPYAEPHPSLRTTSVRQRVYRGYCLANEHVAAAIDAFNEARPRIESLFTAASLADDYGAKALEYLADGYAVLNDPERRERGIVAECRG